MALEDTDDFLSPFCMENNIELVGPGAQPHSHVSADCFVLLLSICTQHILPFVSLEEANVIGQFQNWLAAILQVVLGPRGGHSLLLGR